MAGNWKRNGSFYIKQPSYHANKVVFVNLAHPRVVKSINVYREDNKIYVDIVPAVTSETEFNEAYLKAFGEAELTERYVKIYGAERAKKIMAEKKFPTKFELDSLSLKKMQVVLESVRDDAPELSKDLENILNFEAGDKIDHLVSEGVYAETFVNPYRQHSMELVTLLKKTRSKNFTKEKLKQFKWLLTQGEDPNQRDKEGRSVFFFVILEFDICVLKILLSMGGDPFALAGNPFDVNNMIYGYSSVELAKKEGFHHKLQVIGDAFTKPARSLTSKLQIKDIEIKRGEDQIETHMVSKDNKNILTLFITLADFYNNKKYEKIKYAMLSLFCRIFEDPQGDSQKVLDTFYEDFKPNPDNIHEWIEVVFEQGKLIGANQYALHELSGKNNLKFVEWAYTLVDPEYRGYKVMPFLASRLTHGKKRISPYEELGRYYSSLNYISFTFAKNACTPIYMPAHMPDLLKSVLRKIYGPEVEFEWDGVMEWIVIEKNKLKAKEVIKPSTDVRQKFFDTHVSASQKGAVPVFSYIDKKSYDEAKKDAAGMSLDFGDQVTKFSPHLDWMMKRNISGQSKRVDRIKQHFIKPFQDEETFYTKGLRGPELFWGSKSQNAKPNKLLQLKSKM